jgi:hypothetical protein
VRPALVEPPSERCQDSRIRRLPGPALCLYFAALRSTTSPPSVPLPRREKSAPRHDLSLSTCPTVFIPFLRLWAESVPAIQSLEPERQHDLARTICGLSALVKPELPALNRLAADLRAIAIEISQRRSFQDRYAGDLQAAIDVGAPRGSDAPRVKASFQPPPAYTPPSESTVPSYTEGKAPRAKPPPSPRLAPPGAYPSPPRSPSRPSRTLSPSAQPSQRTPTIATPTSPAIELIRETLYAALADVLASTPSLLPLLKSDPPRAYFGSVALAILAVSSTSVVPMTGSTATEAVTTEGHADDGNAVFVGVRGVPLTLAECPAPLRPLLREFAAIGREAARIEEEDTMEAVRLISEGREAEVRTPRLERTRLLLERGAGYDAGGGNGGRRSAEGRAVAFANRVNALALSVTRLPQFRERQNDVFRVLAGVGVSS